MGWDNIAREINGPLLVKLFLAMVLAIVYLVLRRRDTEGRMVGYAIVAFFLILRDLVFAVLPADGVFIASDLALAILFFSLGLLAMRREWSLWASVGLVAAALAIDAASLAGLFPGFPIELLRLTVLAPLAVVMIRGNPGIPGTALGLGFGLYLLLAGLLGPQSFVLQGLIAPLFYCLLLLPAFLFFESAQRELVRAVEYYEESVDSLYELFTATGSAIKAGVALQEVLDSMLTVAVDKTGADGGIVLLTEEFEEIVAVRALIGRFPPPFKLPESLPRDEERVRDHIRHARFRIGEGLFGEVTRAGTSLFIPDAGSDDRIAHNGDEAWLSLHSLMAAPLIMRDRIIGAIAVSRVGEDSFSERNFDRLKLLASFGSIAVSNAYTFLEAAERGDIEREAAIAEEIQRTILPRKLPNFPGLSLGAVSSPARGVYSDYYDVIPTRPGRVVLAFGDVAGKGVSAGLVMVMIRSILHLIVNSAKDMATLLSWINRGITGKVDIDHFATLGLLAIDTGTGEIEYANAAHQPLLIYRRDVEALETVDIKSIPIGVERGTAYSARHLKLKAGDIVLLYSDGVIETMDEQGRQFGRKNLGAALVSNRELPARELAEAIRDEVKRFSGLAHQHDDQTLLVVKAKS